MPDIEHSSVSTFYGQSGSDQDRVNALAQVSRNYAELLMAYPGFRPADEHEEGRFAGAIGRLRLSLDNLAEANRFYRGAA